MAEHISLSSSDKVSRYEELLPQIFSLIQGENNLIGVLANVSAALQEAMNFFWTGFYLVSHDGTHLELGPFQGSVACFNIKFGRGVCGTAWEKESTQVVPDVERFPGHIACSSLSRSEIVVPIIYNNKVVAVLDIDSAELNTFDETDKKYLEQLAGEIAPMF